MGRPYRAFPPDSARRNIHSNMLLDLRFLKKLNRKWSAKIKRYLIEDLHLNHKHKEPNNKESHRRIYKPRAEL